MQTIAIPIVLQRIVIYLIDPNKKKQKRCHNHYVYLCKRKNSIREKSFLYITRSKDTKDTITYHISRCLLNLTIIQSCNYQLEQITADMVCNGIFSIFTVCNVKEIFFTNVTFSFA